MAARAQVNITDRAKRYRAQNAVTGPRVCVICGSRSDLGVMHLSGNESDGEKANLAYGCRSCNGKLAAAFKKIGAGRPTNQYNPAKGGVPTFEQYKWAVTHHNRGEHDEGGAVIHATPKSKRIEYAKRIAAFTAPARRATAAQKRRDFEDRWNPGTLTRGEMERALATGFDRQGREMGSAQRVKYIAALGKKEPKTAVQYHGESITKTGKQYLIEGWNVAGSGLYRSLAAAKAAIDRRIAARKNPASASAQAFETFHGFAPSEVVTVTKKVFHHAHLASAGELKLLRVFGVDDQPHTIRKFKGAFLAFNEDCNQLFVEGGDQRINLEDFGIDVPHELETLGRVTDIGYQTNKTHLGDEGGEAVYVHKFRTTNDNGRHVVVRIARYPDLIYDVRNEQLLFSGGSYEILAEGINK